MQKRVLVLIGPSKSNVTVLLQAMREDPPPDARCRDKFLVQSIAITPERDLGSITAIVSLHYYYLEDLRLHHNSGKMWRRFPRVLSRSERFAWFSYQRMAPRLLHSITTSMER